MDKNFPKDLLEDDFPILSRIQVEEMPEPYPGYFTGLQARVFKEVLTTTDKRKPDFLNWAPAFLAGAAAVFFIWVASQSGFVPAQDLNPDSFGVTFGTLQSELDFRDLDIETLALNLGSEAMAAEDEAFRMYLDSISPDLQNDILYEIDPLELYNL